MSGYVEAGYVIVLGSLALYATSIVVRERAVRRRLRGLGPAGRAAARPLAEPGDGASDGDGAREAAR